MIVPFIKSATRQLWQVMLRRMKQDLEEEESKQDLGEKGKLMKNDKRQGWCAQDLINTRLSRIFVFPNIDWLGVEN